VIYEDDKYEHTPAVMASKRMLKASGVEFRKYQHTDREVVMKL
jgi:dCMP deaminase